MASLADIVIDCRHPASLARFWASALDGYEIAPYDDAEIARLASLGIDDVDDDPTVLVEADTPVIALEAEETELDERKRDELVAECTVRRLVAGPV